MLITGYKEMEKQNRDGTDHAVSVSIVSILGHLRLSWSGSAPRRQTRLTLNHLKLDLGSTVTY